MATLEHYRANSEYNRWMNRTLFELAAELTEDERSRDLGAFFGSLHGTLNHLLVTDSVWMGRIAADKERFRLRDDDGNPIALRSFNQTAYESFDEFRRQRARLDDDLIELVASLTEEQLAAPVSWRVGSLGIDVTHPTWWALSHLFNHQTHHRGQATTLLKQLGRDPGVTDLVVFMLQQRATTSR